MAPRVGNLDRYPFRYLAPTEIVFGAGASNTAGDIVRRHGTRVLVVTGRHSARVSGALDRIQAQLPEAMLFDAVEENPTTEICAQGAVVCREADRDVVVAIGGGSPMDAAKAIAALALNPDPCADLFGVDKLTRGALPVIAIPTTAGTGSEVTPYAVLVDAATQTKRTISAKALFPACAILDPELTVTMPRNVTASTGLDALSQAMEGLISRRSTALGDLLALETCRRVKRWLPRAVEAPADLEARSHMLYAAMLSGCVIAQSGTTLVHGMGYYFTLEFGLAHGLANALLLTPLFQYSAKHRPDAVAAIATALGFPAAPKPGEARQRVAEALHVLLHEAGISPAARDAGVDPQRLRGFAEDISADRSRFKNQPGEPSVDEVFQFFQQAYDGRIL